MNDIATSSSDTAEKSEGTQAVADYVGNLRAFVRTRSDMGLLAERLPIPLQAVQAILDSNYLFEVGRMELAEKNKGGEYSSSMFSVQTSLDDGNFHRTEGPNQPSSDVLAVLTQPWTLNGLPVNIAMQLVMGRWPSAIPSVKALGADENPVLEDHQSILQNDGARFLTSFARFTSEVHPIRLNGYESAQYLRHLTKWVEMNANPSTNSNHTRWEYDNLLNAYTLFLCDLLSNHLNPQTA